MRAKRLYQGATSMAAGLALMGSSAPAFAQQAEQAAKTTRTAPVPAPAPASPARKAKNIILFIGDGMGISTITAARIYDGQSRGESGEENALAFESFPHTALVKTYNTNQQIPDSAGTASAINTGVKTRAGVINIGPEARRGDCAAAQRYALPTAATRLAARGLAIGIVSTARLTHATPAAVYGHAPERDWESDAKIPAEERAKGCTDLAAQLIAFPFTVALGGGAAQFYGPENSRVEGGKRRAAKADLPRDWARRSGGHYVRNKAEMEAAPQDDKPLLGLFSPSHMSYMLDRKPDNKEPTLTEMTQAAITRLARDPQGYFLMVEAGRIDHGHHLGKAGYALSETQELSRAVAAARAQTDPAETLILVTADHSHVFTIAGYATRGNPILGLSVGNDSRGEAKSEASLATDGAPYTTLGYHNGPGAVTGKRSAPETGPKATQQALVPTGYIDSDGDPKLNETHGGEDVALYATGPGAARASGVLEQNRIYNIMLDALGVPSERAPSGRYIKRPDAK